MATIQNYSAGRYSVDVATHLFSMVCNLGHITYVQMDIYSILFVYDSEEKAQQCADKINSIIL